MYSMHQSSPTSHYHLDAAQTTFAALLDSAPDAIVIVNEAGMIALVNRQAEQMFGYPRATLIDQSVELLLPPRLRGHHVGHRASYSIEPATRPMGSGRVLSACHRDGHEFEVEISLSPLHTAEGLLVTTVIRDISERQRTQAALRDSEARFHAAFANAPIGNALLAAGGDWLLVNQSLCGMLGYTETELLAIPLAALTHPDDRVHDQRQRQQLLDGRQGTARRETRLLHRNGQVVWVLLSVSLVHQASEPPYFIVQFQDITALKQSEAELEREVQRRAERLTQTEAAMLQAARLAAVGQLAAAVAHEINNPLYAARNALLLLEEDAPASVRESPYLQMASDQLGRIAGIIERMRGFYRPGRGEIVPCEANLLVEETLALARLNLRQSTIMIAFTPAHDLPAVQANPDQLRQVFLNLVLNAIEAMPDGGTLTVRTQALPHAVVIDVQDTGVGIAPDARAHLFEPFWTSKPNGTGLGLSISMHIVTQHGGTIDVESVPGQGSLFRVTLPYGADV